MEIWGGVPIIDDILWNNFTGINIDIRMEDSFVIVDDGSLMAAGDVEEKDWRKLDVFKGADQRLYVYINY